MCGARGACLVAIALLSPLGAGAEGEGLCFCFSPGGSRKASFHLSENETGLIPKEAGGLHCSASPQAAPWCQQT